MRKTHFLIILPIALFSFFFSFFVQKTYLSHKEPGHEFPVVGSWIAPNNNIGDVVYFRKEFNVPEPVNVAWVFASSSDRLRVYLNGELLGQKIKDGGYPLTASPVTSRIFVGRNTLGVRVGKRKFGGPVMALVELGYVDSSGIVHNIVTDETWKVSNKEETNVPSTLYWHQRGFNDADWGGVRKLKNDASVWADFDPSMYRSPFVGNWFWAGGGREIFCSTEVEVPDNEFSAWVRVASSGRFALIVNGVELPVESLKLDGEFEQNNITPVYSFPLGEYLRRGSNEIRVNAISAGVERRIYVDGAISGDGWRRTIGVKQFRCSSSSNESPLTVYKGTRGLSGLYDLYVVDKFLISGGGIFGKIFVFIVLTVLFLSCFLALTLFFSKRFKADFADVSATFMFPLLFLASVFMLRYDIRFYSDYPFQSIFVIGSLFLTVICLFLPMALRKIGEISPRAWILAIMVLTLTSIGFYLRFEGLDLESLHWDEAALAEKAQGVIAYGYPSLKLHPDLPLRYTSTSELVSFIQALSFKVFGFSELSLRLPMTIFSTLTIPLLFFFGRLLGGARVGVLCSAVYAFLPTAIGMAQFARYPSQLAFFALLTGFVAFVFFRTEKLRYWVLTAFSFLLAYFSWQGCAFFLLPILVARIIWKRKSALRDTFIFLLIISIPIAAHLVFRVFHYFEVGNFFLGRGVSALTPSLMFLSPLYDPFFYFRNFFMVEGHQFISTVFFAGLALLIRFPKGNKELWIIYLLPLITIFLMTNILGVANYRYVFFLIPYVTLAAGTALFMFFDLLSFQKTTRPIFAYAAVFWAVLLVILSSNLVYKLQNFPHLRSDIKTNPALKHFPASREAALFLKQNAGDDDIIISYQPHLLGKYIKGLDYFFEARLPIEIAILPSGGNFVSLHKVSGTPALLSLDELRTAIGMGRRVWLVATPESPVLLDRETRDFLAQNNRVVFERYRTKIYLLGG